MNNILQTINRNYEKTLDECYIAYNKKEMGVVRESMGKLVEKFVDDVCDMLNQKFDANIECKFGESDRIPITNKSGRVLGFQVDKHIYIDSELKAIVECKSYLDRSMLIRASDDIGRIKQGVEKDIKGFVLSLENAVAQQAEDFGKILAANEKMNNLVNALKKDINDLDKRFNKGGRDFGKVAKEKPKVIERIINKGSDNALRCLEIAMGAELTDKEKAATKKSEINRECPSIANPSYVPYNN